jgi:hypothetical protein
MSRKRLPWDGPNPVPGDYLDTRSPVNVLLIRAVEPLRRPDISGGRLVLDVVSTARSMLVDLGFYTLHPVERAIHTEPAGPPRVRQRWQDGGQSVMRAMWRDPDDHRPNTRRAREIGGWRTYCPLRRMAAQRNSQITERHIIAADYLRQFADQAVHGLSGRDGLLPIGAIMHGPRGGPSAAAITQAFAGREFSRVMRQFMPWQRAMLTDIVLLNRSLSAWCAKWQDNPQIEMGRLVCTLDELERYYASEVDRILVAEQMVRAA